MVFEKKSGPELGNGQDESSNVAHSEYTSKQQSLVADKNYIWEY